VGTTGVAPEAGGITRYRFQTVPQKQPKKQQQKNILSLVNAKFICYFPVNSTRTEKPFVSDDPISRVVRSFPAAFFQNLAEQMDAAFAKALRLSEQHYAEPERCNMLGQSRHACCEEGFRLAAQEAGITSLASHTDPPGGRYSLVKSEGVHLIRSNVQVHCGPPRPTQFRKAWAALNNWLDPVQLDLLKETPPPSPDRLCGMVVVTANKRHGDSSVPAFVGVGIPRSDLSDWVVLEPINNVLALYHNIAPRTHTPLAPVVEIKDRATPRLKKGFCDGQKTR